MSVSPTNHNQNQQSGDRHPHQRNHPTQQSDMTSELRDMISTLTNRLASLHNIHKPAGSSNTGGPHHHENPDDDNGVRIITLAGTNTGATMRTVWPDEKRSGRGGGSHPHHRTPWAGVGRPVGKGDGSTEHEGGGEHNHQHQHGNFDGKDDDDDEGLDGDWGSSAHVNSNIQSINNSIMFGGSYSSKSPGVHMDMTDVVDPPKGGGGGHGGGRPHRYRQHGKKKGEAMSKNEKSETSSESEREKAHDQSHHSI